MANSVAQLKEFFGVSTKEMMEFWKGLSDEEKDEYRNSDLS